MTLDPSETLLFAACETKIYSVELYKRRQQHGYGASETVESVGGMGRVEAVGIKAATSVSREGASTDASVESVFMGHSGMVTSLSLSFDGSLLVSAAEDGNCMVWDVASRQLLRKFEAHKGPVSFVSCFLRPIELQTGTMGHKARPMPWKPFKRTLVSHEEERRVGFEQVIMDTTLVRQTKTITRRRIHSTPPGCAKAPTKRRGRPSVCGAFT